ncbi:MurR/RpiR family transcriptional regulator [Paraliobacillus ryukyuensis]|uniref:MurR/RpiR family transcriptional regulator n=1 Tax=Paraliobacillus ryukyuensis TaxID=200904 RepID=UPI0009A8F7B6|nr:MurR/RpiR family transcriptional regulator [Paraliobacillus ryukyuensis]
MKLEEIINQYYDQLNENDLYILKYIVTNKDSCYKKSINELADACNASRSSVLRLAKKLNFSGYSEFRVFLKWENKQECAKGNHTASLENSIQTTLKDILHKEGDAINQLLFQANRIFIYGSGTAQTFCAYEAQRLFAIIHHYLIVIHDKAEFDTIASDIREDDLVIILSLSGDTPSLIPQVQQLVVKDVPFISITNLKNNKLAQMTPYNLYATSTATKTNNQTELISFIPFYIALELLYRKYVEFLESSKQTPI